MRILLTILMVSFFAINSSAQKEDHIWLLGTYGVPDSIYYPMKMDFNFSPPLISRINTEEISMWETNTMICDATGELVCASNGINIWNNEYEVIENGGAFQSTYPSGNFINQGAIFIPAPENDKVYYLIAGDTEFFVDNGASTAGYSPLHYSKISFTENHLGEVVERKITLTQDTLVLGLLTATRHGNGRDWWILSNKRSSNIFYRFLLSPDGIEQRENQSIGESIVPGLGQSAFSRDGAWYAQYNWFGTTVQNLNVSIDLYHFDRCDGMLSSQLRIFYEEGLPGGVSFSPNNELMYITHWDKIYQYDLTATDIAASIDTVAIYDGFTGQNQNITYPTRFYNMQNSPDGKIIISCPSVNSQYVHIIDSPNIRGDACNVIQHFEMPSFVYFTLPNFPNFRLKELTDSACDTLRPIANFDHSADMLDVVFEDRSNGTPDTWLWDFGNGEISEEQNPEHIYSTPGVYEVCLTARNAIGSDSICQEIILTTVGLVNSDYILDVSIQPNPVIDELNIYFNAPLETNLSLELFNSTGVPVLNKSLGLGIDYFKTNITHLPAGIYLYKIDDKYFQTVAFGKLVILR